MATAQSLQTAIATNEKYAANYRKAGKDPAKYLAKISALKVELAALSAPPAATSAGMVVVGENTYVVPTYPPPNAADISLVWWQYNHNFSLTPKDQTALNAFWAALPSAIDTEPLIAKLGPDLFRKAVWDGRFGPPGTPGTEAYDFSGYNGLTVGTTGDFRGKTVIYKDGVVVASYDGDVRHYDKFGEPLGFLDFGKAIYPPLAWM